MASAVTSSSGSNPLGCLYQNLSTLLEEDPEKYKSFVRGCTEELKVARSKPEPFACLEIEEKTVGEILNSAFHFPISILKTIVIASKKKCSEKYACIFLKYV